MLLFILLTTTLTFSPELENVLSIFAILSSTSFEIITIVTYFSFSSDANVITGPIVVVIMIMTITTDNMAVCIFLIIVLPPS